MGGRSVKGGGQSVKGGWKVDHEYGLLEAAVRLGSWGRLTKMERKTGCVVMGRGRGTEGWPNGFGFSRDES